MNPLKAFIKKKEKEKKEIQIEMKCLTDRHHKRETGRENNVGRRMRKLERKAEKEKGEMHS